MGVRQLLLNFRHQPNQAVFPAIRFCQLKLKLHMLDNQPDQQQFLIHSPIFIYPLIFFGIPLTIEFTIQPLNFIPNQSKRYLFL